MQTVVKKWGNSLALRLPQSVAADLHMEEGSTVSLTIEDRSLVVRPARKRFKLSELLANEKPGQRHAETDWGKPEGEEVW
jgi:antitoxin MazE